MIINLNFIINFNYVIVNDEFVIEFVIIAIQFNFEVVTIITIKRVKDFITTLLSEVEIIKII